MRESKKFGNPSVSPPPGGPFSTSEAGKQARSTAVFYLVFLALAAGIITIASLSYQRYVRNYELEVSRELTSIADLKVSQITQWRKERLWNAAHLDQNPMLADLVRRSLPEPADPEAGPLLQDWLEKYKTDAEYDQIHVLDRQGKSRLSIPAGIPPVAAAVVRRLPDILLSKRPEILDFYKDDTEARPFLSLLIPIREERPPFEVAGILALRINPEEYLYPYISRWPIPSQTAETLLVRRDGEDALFLNDLRFQKNAALELRIPLREQTLAGLAIEGREGIVKGLDYRGFPSIGNLRRIPDSPWFMIARMNESEIFAPLRERFWMNIGMVVAVLFAAVLGMISLQRRQRIRLLRGRLAAERNLRAVSSRQEALLASLPEIIMEVDQNKNYVWANRPGLDFFGEDVIGKEADSYFEGEQDTYRQVSSVFQGTEDVIYVESQQRRRDGRKRLLAWRCRTLKDSAGNVTGALSSARDITEERQAEEIHRESEARYRTLVDNAPLAILVNRENRIVLVNAACLRLFGATSPEQLLGKSPLELFHPDYHRTINDRIDQLKNLGKSVPPLEEKIIRRDGVLRDVEVTAAPFRDQGVNAIHVVLNDITERKKIQAQKEAALEALKTSEEKFRKAFTTSPDSININRLSDGRYVSINKGFTEIMGYKEEEILGRTSSECDIWDDPEDRRRLIESLRKTGAVENLEARFRRKNGDMRVGWMSAVIIEIDRVPHILSITRDITERKRIETALRENEAKFRSIFENIQDLYYETGLDGTILEVSPSIDLLSGKQYRREDLIGKPMGDFYNRPEEREAVLKILLEKGHVADYKLELRNRDGSPIPCSIHARVLFDSLGRPKKIVGSMRNISERKIAEDRMNTAIEALRASLQEKELLLQEIHHRVKNNMQIISSLLNLESEHAAPETRELVKRAQTRIRALSLVHEKLYRAADLSKIDLAGYIETLAVHLFHVYVVDPQKVRLETDFKDVRLDINSAIPCGLILNELISNALKHAFPNGREGVIKIGLTQAPEGMVEFRISDNGVGLPAGVDLDNPSSFGFQIIQLLVDQLDATVELERTNGTSFILKFKELKYKPRI